MEAVIALALIAIMVLLFYRLVERRHKILLAKLLLGLLVLVVLGFGGVYAHGRISDAREARRRQSVRITYLPDSTLAALKSNPVFAVLAPDTVKEIRFRLCNVGPDTVLRVSFAPVTLRRGRSTEHDVLVWLPYEAYVPNELSSDLILAPRDCSVMTWSGQQYLVLDTVIARVTSVTAR